MDSFAIRGALVYDGTGGTPFEGDVAVSDGCIEKVAPSGSILRTGLKSIDAKGLSLSPGFIDSHGHSDVSLLASPDAFGKISQGVTTEVAGNCGLSAFPLTGEVREHLLETYREYGERLDWSDVSGYAAELGRRRPRINLAALCGHNTLRACVCGYGDKPCGMDGMAKMKYLLRDSLSKGAAGLSTGLVYVPGKFAGGDELDGLAEELKAGGKLLATHLRSEGDRLLEALGEAVGMASKGSRLLHVSHLKTSGNANWGKLSAALELLGRASGSGLRITGDRYPYIHSKTSLSMALPKSYRDMDDVSLGRLLGDPSEFERLSSILDSPEFERDWEEVIIASTSAVCGRGFCGMSVAEAGRMSGIPAGCMCASILREDAPGSTAAFGGGMSQGNLERIVELPWVCCGSDESARPADYSIGRSHPRGFGSFPRFIRMVAERQGMAEAVRRVSGLPAGIFGLKGRGLIKEGFKADLTLFDETELEDTASFAEPHSPARGIRKVWVEGSLSFDSGSSCGAGAGSFIAV